MRTRTRCVICYGPANGDYCRPHHAMRYGTTADGLPRCHVGGIGEQCPEPVNSRGMCKTHAARDRRYGDAMTVKRLNNRSRTDLPGGIVTAATQSDPRPSPHLHAVHTPLTPEQIGTHRVAGWWPLDPIPLPDVAAADWRERAACIGLRPELFEQNLAGGRGVRVIPHIAVIAACAICPVRADCDRDAEDMGDGEHTWRGGISPAVRARRRRMSRSEAMSA